MLTSVTCGTGFAPAPQAVTTRTSALAGRRERFVASNTAPSPRPSHAQNTNGTSIAGKRLYALVKRDRESQPPLCTPGSDVSRPRLSTTPGARLPSRRIRRLSRRTGS
jgi:hypothetical protein